MFVPIVPFVPFVLWLVVASYTDPQQRFRFEVHQPFELHPRFGDLSGIRLIAPEPPRRGGGPVVFEVRVVEADRCARGRIKTFGSQPWRARSLGDGQAYARTVGPVCLEAKVTGSSRARRRTEPVVYDMLKSMGPVRPNAGTRARGADPGPVGVIGSRGANPGGKSRGGSLDSDRRQAPVSAGTLAGRWVDARGKQLRLAPDGTFKLGAIGGRWKVEASTLSLSVQGKPVRMFRVRVRGEVLEMSGGGLKTPLRYKRRVTREAVEPSAEPSLPGRWKRGRLILELRGDGVFSLGPHTGVWRLTEGRLRLERGPTDIVSYRYELAEGALVLSGADLDVPVRLKRVNGGPASR